MGTEVETNSWNANLEQLKSMEYVLKWVTYVDYGAKRLPNAQLVIMDINLTSENASGTDLTHYLKN